MCVKIQMSGLCSGLVTAVTLFPFHLLCCICSMHMHNHNPVTVVDTDTAILLLLPWPSFFILFFIIVVRRWSLVIGCWLLVAGRWSLLLLVDCVVHACSAIPIPSACSGRALSWSHHHHHHYRYHYWTTRPAVNNG